MSEFNLYDGNDNNYSSNSYSSSYNSYSSDSRSASSGLFGKKVYTAEGEILSLKAFYGAILGCLLWGFVINAIICTVFQDAVLGMNPIVLLVFYFISCIAGIIIYKKSNKPLISFLGYNLIVLPIGLVLAVCLSAYSDMVINSALITTAVIVGLMTVLGFTYPQVFRQYGSAIGATLIVVVLADIVLTFIFGMDLVFIDYLVSLCFALYIAVDLARASNRPYTLDNAVDTAAELYLDIINLFIRILRIMGRSRN